MLKAAKVTILTLATITMTLPASGEKLKGSSTLKDFQPFGTTDKDHKNQAYDLSFDAKDHSYTCRTNYKKSINATDFVVGSQISYEIDDNKATIKSPQNKKVQCMIVRVEKTATTP
jgi:lipopolysaccharide export system protein LptA